MTLDWIAPASTAAVGIAGIAAALLTARAGNRTQLRTQSVALAEARRMTLRQDRRVAYGKFLQALRELDIRMSVNEQASEGLFSDAVVQGLESSLSNIEPNTSADDIVERHESRLRTTMKDVLDENGLMSRKQGTDSIAMILALGEDIRLIGGAEVVAAVDVLLAKIYGPFNSLLNRKPVAPEDQRALIIARSQVRQAMANELDLDLADPAEA